ncbi:MAG: S41 family peptidase [bacterium]
MKTCRMLVIAALYLCIAGPASAEREARSMSRPEISPDGRTVFFSCWGDIWSAPRDGSAPARRLSANVAYDTGPLLSPDGRTIAFNSDRFGNWDIFTMPVEGGPPTRLTWDSTSDYLTDWNPDGSGLLEFAVYEQLWDLSMFEVPLDGSTAQRVSNEDHDGHVFGRYLGDTGRIVYCREPGSWSRKNYHGTYAYDIYMYDPASGKHTQLTDYDGKDCWPQPSPDGSLIYFVSDRDGHENLWVMNADGSGLRQLTELRKNGPRWPRLSADGDEIIYEKMGQLYVIPAAGGSPERISVSFADDPLREMVEERTFRGDVSEYRLSPNGNYFALVVSGDIYILKNPDSYKDEEKPDQDLSQAFHVVETAAREMSIDWLPDSKHLVYLSDRAEQFDVYMLDLETLEETQLTDTPGDESGPDASPAGNQVMWYSDKFSLMLHDVDSGSQQVVHSGRIFGITGGLGFEWSPDGKWISFVEGYYDGVDNAFIMNLEDREPINISRSPEGNSTPQWSPDGKWLAFGEGEGYGEVYMPYYPGLSAGSEVMLIELNPEQEEYDLELLFEEDMPEPEPIEQAAGEDGKAADDDRPAADREADKGGKEKKEDKDKDGKDIPEVVIKLDRIDERAYPIRRNEGGARSPLFAPDGSFLIYSTRHDGEVEWWTYELEKREIARLDSGRKASPQFTKDGKRLYFSEGGNISYMDLRGSKSSGGGRVASSCTQTIDQYERWDQMLVEGWRALKNYFYDPEMMGVDWDDVLKRYRPRVREIGTYTEFGTLYREMIDELGASHMGYTVRGNEREAPADSTASLAVKYDDGFSGPGWRVLDVLTDGPADRDGSRLYPGDVILSINGETISAASNRARLLNNLSGEPLRLEVRNGDAALSALGADAAETRTVDLKPIGGARGLAYQDWVRDNRSTVEGESGGRIAYQHIRGMNLSSLVQFRKELYADSFDKDALIIDVRFNGGGSTSVEIMEMLTRQAAYWRQLPGAERREAARQLMWEGPIVVLINPHSYSNAEIFAHIMKDHKIATVIGETTGGNVISTGGYGLVDGSFLRMPGYLNMKYDGTDMEGNGCVPDIMVPIDPEQLANGVDNQLEAAISFLLDEIGN